MEIIMECIECFDDENATWVTPDGYAICIRCIRDEEKKGEQND
tara:strand:- start:55 stop:183 length:129 start_codon:yes stop_codon:yes gene_type:complete